MMMKALFSLVLCMIALATTAQTYDFIVAQDGSGDFTSIQKAIDATKAFPPRRFTIFIKNGEYKEKVKVHAWNNDLTIIGENAEKTIITNDDHFNKIDLGRNSTFHTWTVLVQGDNFIAENLTIANTSGPVGQAVALSVESDRCRFKNVRILGHQDALYASGINCRQYYQDCYIEGTTDFIFGSATAIFENCTIHSLSNSYITAASTFENQEFGYVFLKCKLTAAPDVTDVYLGRPWRENAKTVFIECEMDSHINPEGWKEWSNSENLSATFYAEYNNSGEGSEISKRVPWSHQLSPKEAKRYTKTNIFKAIKAKNVEF